jgi:protein involved in sex pheromone biosynthesis
MGIVFNKGGENLLKTLLKTTELLTGFNRQFENRGVMSPKTQNYSHSYESKTQNYNHSSVLVQVYHHKIDLNRSRISTILVGTVENSVENYESSSKKRVPISHSRIRVDSAHKFAV